ncbi:unnamed protein product [Cercospora beticola]|nr:unnamed protein product [Cercospora beticola]
MVEDPLGGKLCHWTPGRESGRSFNLVADSEVEHRKQRRSLLSRRNAIMRLSRFARQSAVNTSRERRDTEGEEVRVDYGHDFAAGGSHLTSAESIVANSTSGRPS